MQWVKRKILYKWKWCKCRQAGTVQACAGRSQTTKTENQQNESKRENRAKATRKSEKKCNWWYKKYINSWGCAGYYWWCINTNSALVPVDFWPRLRHSTFSWSLVSVNKNALRSNCCCCLSVNVVVDGTAPTTTAPAAAPVATVPMPVTPSPATTRAPFNTVGTTDDFNEMLLWFRWWLMWLVPFAIVADGNEVDLKKIADDAADDGVVLVPWRERRLLAGIILRYVIRIACRLLV